ncbi:hypothetical protein IKE13_03325 [Candidatus Saccharibacteria bacterium]|nr:hypothetical protein [Candidatus Saccharibacteria bacterium]
MIKIKYKNAYENCKRLVSCGVGDRSPGFSEYEVYADSFGCDLKVYRNVITYFGTGKMIESIKVYLGGREVYRFNEDEPSWEFIVRGYWEKLVVELWRYESAIYFEESYSVNGALVELCKRESMRNRKMFDKYRELCVPFARKNGAKLESEVSCSYRFRRRVEGHDLEIDLREMPPKEKIDYDDRIEVYFDKKIVFKFHYNCSNIGGIFDEKGMYTPGEWEQIVERLIKNS